MEESKQGSDYVREEIPTPMVSDEIWKLILDRSKIPETLTHMIKGEVWVVKEEKGDYIGRWESRGDPLMNEKGIRFFTPFLYSVVTPDKLTTFITEKELNRLMMDMVETIIDVIIERGDEFGIPASNRSFVARLLEQFYFLSLSASRKGTILQALKPAYERKELYTPRDKAKFRFPSFLGGNE